MPRPKKLGERRLAWDVRAIDLAINLLPVHGDDTDEFNMERCRRCLVDFRLS